MQQSITKVLTHILPTFNFSLDNVKPLWRLTPKVSRQNEPRILKLLSNTHTLLTLFYFPSLQSLSSPGRRSPLPPRSWGSRRSSWNSLGRAPSLKRRDTSGERESLLSGEGGEEEDSGEDKGEAGANNRLRPEPLELLQASTLCPSIIAEYSDCNGRTLTYDPTVNADPKEDSSPEDDTDDEVRYHEL